jgi:hypothetical protein
MIKPAARHTSAKTSEEFEACIPRAEQYPYSSTARKKVEGSSNFPATTQECTPRLSPEDHTLNIHRRDNPQIILNIIFISLS